MRRRLVVNGLVSAVALVTLCQSPALAETPLDDGQKVYCLAPANSQSLIDSAIALGLAQRGVSAGTIQSEGSPHLTPIEWATLLPVDFDRSCRALVASTSIGLANYGKAATGGTPTQLQTTLISTVAGAMLALIAGTWVRSRERRRTDSLGLRAAFSEYSTAATEYFAAWSAPTVAATPSSENLLQSKEKLCREISYVISFGVYRFPVESLMTELTGTKHGVLLTTGWAGKDGKGRLERVGLLSENLNKLDQDVQALARAFEQAAPIRIFQRKRVLSSTGSSTLTLNETGSPQ